MWTRTADDDQAKEWNIVIDRGTGQTIVLLSVTAGTQEQAIEYAVRDFRDALINGEFKIEPA